MNSISTDQSNWQANGMTALRIITGLLMAYHGLEVFQPQLLQEYAKWEIIQNLPAPLAMVYIGKGLELITGILFVIGLFTRTAAIMMAIDMLFICFKIGGGKFYYQDQHPFLFALLALVFFFYGAGRFSFDYLFTRNKI